MALPWASVREMSPISQHSLMRMAVCIRSVAPDEGERLREIAIAAKGYWVDETDRVREWAAMGDFSAAGLQQKDCYIAAVEGRAVGWAAAIDPAFPTRGRARAPSGRGSNGVGSGAERPRLLQQDGRPLPTQQRRGGLGSSQRRNGRRSLLASHCAA